MRSSGASGCHVARSPSRKRRLAGGGSERAARSISVELSTPHTSASGQRSASVRVSAPGPQPRSVARCTAPSGRRATRSKNGCARSRSKRAYCAGSQPGFSDAEGFAADDPEGFAPDDPAGFAIAPRTLSQPRWPSRPPAGTLRGPTRIPMKPTRRPERPEFSSGPCAKRPGWRLAALAGAALGRSHRARIGLERLRAVIDRSGALLGMPSDYKLGIVPASDTGAVEMAMWSLLGERPVDVLCWESFGQGWANDVKKQMKLDA